MKNDVTYRRRDREHFMYADAAMVSIVTVSPWFIKRNVSDLRSLFHKLLVNECFQGPIEMLFLRDLCALDVVKCIGQLCIRKAADETLSDDKAESGHKKERFHPHVYESWNGTGG